MYLEPYRQAVEAHGAGFAATLWHSAEWQQLRFAVMLDMLDVRDAVILDAGCGTGDFAAFLLERDAPFAQYIGVDGIAAQVENAHRRGMNRCEFHVGDFAHEEDLFTRFDADIICFSGSLNTFDEAEAKITIERAFRAARDAVIFNFLSDRAARRFDNHDLSPARRFDTLGMVDFALRLSPRIRFRHEYLDGHDATILIERAENE